jgi:Fe-S cluster assembly ATP-binding protein
MKKTQTRSTLEIKNLHVEVEGQEIIKGLNLTIKAGEIHIIMGPNGSGKSTLCYAIMGHPRYHISKGDVRWNGQSILDMEVDKRAKLGLFLGFQYPREVAGITFGNFLRIANNALKKAQSPQEKPLGPVQFLPIVKESMQLVKMDPKFIGRAVNEGFSGGEKKRAEIVQMATLKPQIAMLDEIDSGLDIDALKIVAAGIQAVFERNSMGVLLITHYQRILNYLTPHFVHIMVNGKIIKSGGHDLAVELEKEGYSNLINN